jgi:addiction module RelE/StbE family toxin
MQIIFSKRFKKQYKKLPPKLQIQTKNRIELWSEQPDNPILKRHKLEGALNNFYSINISGDLRALYEVIDEDIYIYEMIGSHSQLYG